MLAIPLKRRNKKKRGGRKEKGDDEKAVFRYVLAKRHRPATGKSDETNTVFLANVQRPTFVVSGDDVIPEASSMQLIRDDLKMLFQESGIGIVENVTLKRLKGDKGSEASCLWCAHVTFESASSLERIFNSTEKKNKKAKGTNEGPLVLQYTADDERVVNSEAQAASDACATLYEEHLSQYEYHAKLEEMTNMFIDAFETREEQIRLARERKINEKDEDGFTLVSRKRQVRHATMDANEKKRRRKKKKKNAELTNFYRFQIRESKRNQLAVLREEFEADKQRIERLKASRKFRPY